MTPTMTRLEGNGVWAELWLGDCLEVLPKLGKVDAVVTDPPYGMNNDTDTSRFSGGYPHSIAKRGGGCEFARGRKPIIGDDKPFDPSPWLDFSGVVLWGSNHFWQRLPVGTTLVWLKRLDPAFGSFLSDAELAWVKGGCGIYCKRDLSMNSESRDRKHPNQKPTAIMQWCLSFLNGCQIILDPYMGSGTTGVACMRTGRNFIGVEIEKRYFDIAVERIQRELNQLKLAL